MIYLLYGNDLKQKRAKAEMLSKGASVVTVIARQLNKDILISYAAHVSLFGDSYVILLPGAITEAEEVFSKTILTTCAESKTIFIFIEDTLLATKVKEYQKYITEAIKCEAPSEKIVKTNPFVLTDFFAQKDKINAWATYLLLIEKGESPEALAGMLFWKIKTIITKNERSNFSKKELTHASWKLVALYHAGHEGVGDMKIGLEQYILETLA